MLAKKSSSNAPRRCSTGAGQTFGERLRERGLGDEPVRDRGLAEVALRREVVVQGRHVEAGGGRDRPHARAARALPGHEAERRVEDAGALVGHGRASLHQTFVWVKSPQVGGTFGG